MNRLIFILIICASIAVLLPESNAPFNRLHDFNGVEYGIFDRNHLRFGLMQTKLGQLTQGGAHLPIESVGYNTHHLILLPLVISVFYKLFGVSELITRVPFVICSALTIGILYLIGYELKKPLVGLVASILALLTPMVRFYGKNPVHEPLLTLENVILSYLYLKYLKTGRQFYFFGLCLTTLLIGLTGWPGYFFIPGILLHLGIFNRHRISLKFLMLPLILCLTFALHLFHVRLLTGTLDGGGLKDVLLYRLNAPSSPQAQKLGFTWNEYRSRLNRALPQLFSSELVILSLVWMGFFLLILLFPRFTRKEGFFAHHFARSCHFGVIAGLRFGNRA